MSTSRVVSSVADGMAYCSAGGYPVKIQAHFVIGGWQQTARTEDEARTLIREGLELSPVSKVDLVWN